MEDAEDTHNEIRQLFEKAKDRLGTGEYFRLRTLLEMLIIELQRDAGGTPRLDSPDEPSRE